MLFVISAFILLFSNPGLDIISSSTISTSLNYPEFDKQLLKIWVASGDEEKEGMAKTIKLVEEEWANVQVGLSRMEIEHIDLLDFIKTIDSYVLSLEPCEKANNYSRLHSISYHILYEFRSLRQCFYRTEYPLDNLWESMDVYIKIKKTINDRMFNLKEWFEFEDDLNDFICKWEYYEFKHINEIQSYFPGINQIEHSELKEKVNSCTYSLMKSIETGFQSDFVMPCDELGQALNEIMRMYANSKTKMLL